MVLVDKLALFNKIRKCQQVQQDFGTTNYKVQQDSGNGFNKILKIYITIWGNTNIRMQVTAQ